MSKIKKMVLGIALAKLQLHMFQELTRLGGNM